MDGKTPFRLTPALLMMLDSADIQVLVTDAGTGAIYYVNRKMLSDYGIVTTPAGQPADEVFFTMLIGADGGAWELYDDAHAKWYAYTRRPIEWDQGSAAYLYHGVDITAAKNKEALLELRVRQQKLLSDISNGFLSHQADIGETLQSALKSVGEFLSIDRVLFVRAGEEEDACEPLAAWRKDAAWEGDDTYFPVSTLVDRQYIACPDTQADPRFTMLAAQGVKGFIAAFISIENSRYILRYEICERQREILESEIYLTTTVANIIGTVLVNEATRGRMRQMERQTQLMLDSTPLICSIWDDRGHMIDCNRETLRVLKLKTKAEYIERFYELNPLLGREGEATASKAHAHLQRAVEAGFDQFHWVYQTGDGESLPVEITLRRVEWDGGYRVLAYSRDLRAEEAERDKATTQEAYRQLMLDATPLATFLMDKKGNVVDCNEEAVRLFQAENKAELVDNFFQVYSPGYQNDGELSEEKAAALITQTYKRGETRFEWLHRTRPGEIVPTEVLLRRVSWRDNHYLIGYARDLRSVKRAENEIKQKSRLLETLNVVCINLMYGQADTFDKNLDKAMAVLGQGMNVDAIRVWSDEVIDGEKCFRKILAWPKAEKEDDSLPREYKRFPYLEERMQSKKKLSGIAHELPAEERETLGAKGIRSVMLLPRIVANNVVGFMSFEDARKERVFSASEEQAMRSACIMITSALLRYNAIRSMNQTNDTLRRNEKLLVAVNTVAEMVLKTGEEIFDEVLGRSLEIMGNAVGACRASLWQNDFSKDDAARARRLRVWTRRGERLFELRFPAEIDLYCAAPEWQREAHELADIGRSERAGSAHPLHGAKETLLLIPLVLRETFWGFIAFSHPRTGHLFTGDERAILRSGGMMVASAVIREETNKKLLKAKEDALLSVRAKNEFLARMSHEIRTPMNAVIGMAAVARRSDDLEKIRQSLDVIDASSGQLMNIINDVLDISQVDIGELSLTETQFDVSEALDALVQSLRAHIDEKGLRFTYRNNWPPDKPILSDRYRLMQIVNNLMSNAIKFSGEGGSVALHASEKPISAQESIVRFEVIDEGIGIDPDFLPFIFQPFEQADGGLSRRYGGTGLGLPICKGIVDKMGGTIEVESEKGKGSRFVVEAPVKLNARAETDMPGSEWERPDWSDKRILLVEDIEINQLIAMELLSESGAQVICASDGQEAVDLFSEAPDGFDVILMDMQMPVMDGIAATKHIRALNMKRAKNIPILAMTANINKKDVEACIKAGMNGHIPKPIDMDYLYDTIDKVFSGVM